ncbi:MAG: glycosyltransferase family 39 protein [Candidatus Shapirobacteria bacterium]
MKHKAKGREDGRLVFKRILFGIVFCYLTILKLHNYDRVPYPVHAEELLYGWSGIHLIETGVPTSWSTLEYPKSALVYDGIVGDKSNMYLPAKLYRPWLDEPPLFSLMAGGVAHLFKSDRTKVINPAYSRMPTVVMSLLTMVLIFWVGKMFFGYKIGMLAMMFYGVTPIFVFGSRLSVPENVIALAAIGTLGLAKIYEEKPNFWLANFFGILAAILGLMKPTGFFLAPLLIYVSFGKKRYQDIGAIFFWTVLGILAFAYYGYYYDWELFRHIVAIQGQRFAGWTGMATIFTTPAFDIFVLKDGWYIFAFLMALFFCLRKNFTDKYRLVALFFFYFLMVAIFSGTEGDLLPWYRYPTFPFLAIFGALGLRYVLKKANFFSATLVFGLLMTSRFFLANDFRPTTSTLGFRLSLLFILLPSLLALAKRLKTGRALTRSLMIVFVLIGAFLNSRFIYSAFEVNCENKTCPMDKQIILSRAKFPIVDRFFKLGDSTDMLTTKRPWF